MMVSVAKAQILLDLCVADLWVGILVTQQL